jgi:hypothetical protein
VEETSDYTLTEAPEYKEKWARMTNSNKYPNKTIRFQRYETLKASRQDQII